jgi:integrase/recombinase XerC
MTMMVPVPRPENTIALLPKVGPLDLFDALLADAKCPNTRNSRLNDVRAIARILGQSEAAACALFVSGGRAQANAIGSAFRAAQQELGLSASTINRRLSCLRRVARLAKRYDLIEWAPDVDDLPGVAVRDTRGPSGDEWAAIWAFAVACGDSPIARRNRALLRLLHDSALRKSEALAIDVEDLDLPGERCRIIGKGASGKSWITISPTCVKLLREWLSARNWTAGPVFVSHIRRDALQVAAFNALVAELRGGGATWAMVAAALNGQGSLTHLGNEWTDQRVENYVASLKDSAPYRRFPGRECNRLLKWMSAECGIERPVKPHGIRHAAITTALRLTGGDLPKVQRYARHKSPVTTVKYWDNIQDVAGEITRQLGDI